MVTVRDEDPLCVIDSGRLNLLLVLHNILDVAICFPGGDSHLEKTLKGPVCGFL